MIARPCLTCGRLTTKGSRCVTCRKAKDRARGTPTERGYDSGWARLSRQIREDVGECAVCGTTERLTVDHIEPHSFTAGVRVLCVRCHGKHGRQSNRKEA